MNETRPTLAKRATDLLAGEQVDPPAPSADERARAIARISAAIEDGARRRRRTRAILAATAIAACACAIFAIAITKHRSSAPVATSPATSSAAARTIVATGSSMEGDAVAFHAGAQTSLDRPVAIDTGDRLIASAGARAALTLSTGTRIVVEGGSELDVIEQDVTQIYALKSGSIRAEVAKLAADERFVVRTSDAEVEVRGTAFRLVMGPSDPSCGGGTVTRLYVEEGVVVVRANGGEDRVAAGEKWPRGCDVPVPIVHAPSSVPSESASSLVAVAPSPSSSNKLAPPAATLSASDLQAQNDLFAVGVAQKHGGNVGAAIATFERLLAKYPAGPLAESATVERMRALASLDHARGAVAAKAYLARYPQGFARAEAEGLAGP